MGAAKAEPVHSVTVYHSAVGLPSLVDFNRTGTSQMEWPEVTESRLQRYSEIIYVMGGTGRIAIEGQWYDASAHHVFFMPPEVTIDIVTQDEDKLDLLYAHFHMRDDHHYRRVSGPAPFILEEMESQNGHTYLSTLAVPDRMALPKDNQVLRFMTTALEIYESRAPGFYQRTCAFLLIALHQLFDELMALVSEGATGSRYRTLILARRIKNFISERPTTFSGLDELGEAFRMNSQHLSRVFKRTYGESIVEFANRMRVEAGKVLLANTNDSIPDIAKGCGFKTTNHFQRVFRKVVGLSPLEFRSVRSVGSTSSSGIINHNNRPVEAKR